MNRIAALAVLLCAGPASSQDLSDLEGTLNESVVSTASRSAERLSAAPGQIVNITSDQLRLFGIRTVDEALNLLGVGIYAATTAETLQSLGVTTEVGSRGVMFRDGGSRVLVLLDGHITNSQLDGRSWVNGALGVPIEIIDHIEVLLGPGSVVYGSSAFLGVVNVVTRRGRDLPGVAATASVALLPPQGDDRNLTSVGGGDALGAIYRFSLSLGKRFTLFSREADFVAQGEWTYGSSGSLRIGPQYGDYTQGFFSGGAGALQGAFQNRVNAPALVATLTVGTWRLALHVNRHERSAPLIGTFPGGDSSGGDVRHVGLDLSNRTPIGRRFTLASRLYADATEQRINQYVSELLVGSEFPGGEVFTTTRLSRWLGLEEQGVFDWLIDGRLVTTLGLDVRGRWSLANESVISDPITQKPSQLEGYTHISSTTALIGAYLQQVYNPRPWLSLNAGLRLDADPLFGEHLSPRAAVVVTRLPGNSIKLMYAEAFRAPLPIELYSSIPYQRIAPTTLDPEVVRSLEVEVSQRWSSGRAAVNGYLSFYSGMIADRLPTQDEYDAAVMAGKVIPFIPPQAFVRYDNLGSMRGLGLSLSAEQRLPAGLALGLNFLLSSTVTHDQDDTDQDLLFTPSWFGNLRLSWQLRPDGPAIGLVAQLLGPRPVYLASPTPALARTLPVSADLRLTGTVPVSPVRGLSARLIAAYSSNGEAPIQVGGFGPANASRGPELIPIPRSFFLAEVRYEHN